MQPVPLFTEKAEAGALLRQLFGTVLSARVADRTVLKMLRGRFCRAEAVLGLDDRLMSQLLENLGFPFWFLVVRNHPGTGP